MNWKVASLLQKYDTPAGSHHMHLLLLLQTTSLAAEILPFSYHPSSSSQILSSLCSEGFLSKLFFSLSHPSSSAALRHCKHSLRAPGSDKLQLCEAGQEENDALQREEVIKVLKENEVGEFVRARVEPKPTFPIGILFKIILACTGLFYMNGGCFDFTN